MNTIPPPIHVWFEEGVEAGAPVRRLIFEGVRDGAGSRCETWWRFPGESTLAALPALDPLVGAHLLSAAQLNQDLVVHGPLSAGGLRHLRQLMELRRALSPDRYPRCVEIVPERVVDGLQPIGPPNRAVAAFSGGLDSTFTVGRHAHRLVGERAFELAGLVMVFGFDAPLSREDRFDAMARRAEPAARALGLPIRRVISNAMQWGGRAWPQSAMPLFVSVLAQFHGTASVGLVSAGAPYGLPRFASISHAPFLDQYSSCDYFRLVTDGGGFNRAQKIDALKSYPELLAGLKVCWQGPDPARNCGVCPKCVLTRLDFLAAGIPDPPCFDSPLTAELIERMPLQSMQKARDLFRFAWAELSERGVGGPAVAALRRRLSRVPPDFVAPVVQRWEHRVRWALGRLTK